MKTIILGAGASKCYNTSPTSQKMPLAKDFFQTFNHLKISEEPMVLIGYLLNYLERYQGVKPIDFMNYSVDIEQLHSEIEENLLLSIQQNDKEIIMRTFNAYNQLIVSVNLNASSRSPKKCVYYPLN